MTDTDIAKELNKIEKRLNELDNDPVMQIIHSMAQEQKKSNKRWLQRFVSDEQLR